MYNNLEPARAYLKKKLKDKTIRILFEEEKIRTELARLVRSARETAGLSQRELARRAKTTQAVVARLELGTDSRVPSITLIAKLLRAANAHLELSCVFDRVS